MPSRKQVAAVRVARALTPAELAVNEAAIGFLTVSAEMLRARTSGGFGTLEGQAAVDKTGQVTTMLFGVMSQMADAHTALRGVAADHDLLGYGDLCPPPKILESIQSAENVSRFR